MAQEMRLFLKPSCSSKNQHCTGSGNNVQRAQLQAVLSNSFLQRNFSAEQSLWSCWWNSSLPFPAALQTGNHRIPEFFGLEADSAPTHCHEQGHLSLAQVVPSLIQTGLEYFQGWGVHTSLGNIWMFLKGCSCKHHP